MRPKYNTVALSISHADLSCRSLQSLSILLYLSGKTTAGKCSVMYNGALVQYNNA